MGRIAVFRMSSECTWQQGLQEYLKWASLFIFLFWFSLPVAAAQDPEINFMNMGSRDGLSSNAVNAILKDRYGYMWFATDDGLNKFDGSHFTVYRHDPEDRGSISSNDILDLHEDGKGNLWIGTGAGLELYDRKRDNFVKYFTDVNNPVTSICSDRVGRIWVAGYHGVSAWEASTGKRLPLNVKAASNPAVLTQTVIRLFCDSKGRVWVGTSQGLYVYSDKRKTFTKFRHEDAGPEGVSGSVVRAICEDRFGAIWIGTDNGLNRLRPDNRTFDKYRCRANDPHTLSSDIIYSIAPDSNGELWVGTEEGLSILNPATGKVRRIESSGRNKYGLVGKSVKAILIDQHGIYWVATFRSGVNKYDKNLAFFNLRQSNVYDPKGLSAPVVTSFAPGPGSKVYVGTDGGGLNLFDPASGTFNHISLSPSAQSRGLQILTMERVDSEIWIGTFLHGLFVLDIRTGKSRQIRKGAGGISGNDIFCIKKDSRGNVWIGTNGQGLDCYFPRENIFRRFSSSEKGAGRIETNGFIRAIEEDSKGNIWIGSNGSGITVYNPVTGYSRVLNQENSKLPNNKVAAITAASGGTIWVGMGGGGLARYDDKTSRFISYSERNGLANGVIYKILEDQWGKIWVSTNKGLSCFDSRKERFNNYSYHNGLQRSPFVSGAGLRLADGTLFFGGVEGFNFFRPEKLRVNKNVPAVVLTDLKVSNQTVIPSEDAEISENISVAREIDLDYKQNFSLSFVALNYTSPEENRYLYKLENFDKDWNRVGPVNTAVYTNLDPGEYVFKVKATTDSGDWSTGVTTIRVIVRPPFWLTYYAYGFYFVLIGFMLWYLRYRGIQKLKARFALEQERLRVQQQIEQERREAERIHAFDQLRIKFLTNLSHEFRTPISLIIGPVEELLQQETSRQKSDRLGMIRRNARRLLNLVNELLDFRNMEQKELRLNALEGDLISFARDVADSFRDLSERKKIHFEFRSSLRDFFTFFDHDKIERVLFNLLSNAFKFTLPGGEVTFSIETGGDREGVLIKISDTGIGIQEKERMKVFDRFFQAETAAAVLNQGSGIGLSITKEFVSLHGGTIDVQSIEGKGSAFIIHLPLRRIEDDFVLEEDAVIQIADETDVADQDLQSPPSPGTLPVVLLVEDNEDFRYYLKENLKTAYRVIEAVNGKEGWQKVLAVHPQVVISDISMPYMNGIDLCGKIKSDKRTCHIPVLLLTALTAEEEQVQGLKTGADDYMTKPCNFSILHLKIRNLLALNERLKATYSKQIKVAAPEVKVESDGEKLLSKVIRYIDENLTNPQLSVEILAKELGMSRGSLYTKMLELTGETPVEFIRSIKLDRAAVLLEKSDMNVAQVSYSVGFATPNYFARSFRNRFNMQPSEYISLKRGSEKK